MDNLSYQTPTADIAEAENARLLREFYYVGTLKFWLLAGLSAGVYITYWVYRQWKAQKEFHQLEVNPILYGIFHLFFISKLTDQVDQSIQAKESDHEWQSGELAAGFIFNMLAVWALSRFTFDGLNAIFITVLGNVLLFIGIFFIYRIQATINALAPEDHVREGKAFTVWNYLWLAVFTIVMVPILIVPLIQMLQA